MTAHFNSNVAPKRRVRPTHTERWRCKCQGRPSQPPYLIACPRCRTERV